MRRKVSYLTCILIEGTFPSTNQHPVRFRFQKFFNAQGALQNVVAQRKIIFESQIDP